MSTTDAQKRAYKKYSKDKVERLSIRVKKGDRDKYIKFAHQKGKSLNKLMIDLIEKEIKKK